MNVMEVEPENGAKVLLANNSTLELCFGVYKDGKYQENNSTKWHSPDRYYGWIDARDVKFRLGIP